MTELMDNFYACVGKTIVENILSEDGEYCVRTSHQNDEVKRLIASLDKNIATLVDDLLGEQMAISELRECAYFRAGRVTTQRPVNWSPVKNRGSLGGRLKDVTS